MAKKQFQLNGIGIDAGVVVVVEIAYIL